MWFLLALIVRALARLLLRTGQDGTKDLEILVLQHQLRVLHRKTGPPKFRPSDRVLLAVASRAIPRERWVAFLVTLATCTAAGRSDDVGEARQSGHSARPLHDLRYSSWASIAATVS